MTGSYCDASDDPGLSHQVHEGVLNPDQNVSGHPVTAALLYVGAWGMRVVTSRRWRPRCHRTVANWAGTRTGLWRKQEGKKILEETFTTLVYGLTVPGITCLS